MGAVWGEVCVCVCGGGGNMCKRLTAGEDVRQGSCRLEGQHSTIVCTARLGEPLAPVASTWGLLEP